MTWLLRQLAGTAGPYILLAAVALVLGLGATILVQRVTIADLRTDKATCAGQNAGLAAGVQLQNAAVEGIQKDCREESEAAAAAALRALNQHVPPPAGAGPGELNQWFARRLARSSPSR